LYVAVAVAAAVLFDRIVTAVVVGVVYDGGCRMGETLMQLLVVVVVVVVANRDLREIEDDKREKITPRPLPPEDEIPTTDDGFMVIVKSRCLLGV
jgi:hypothetical protein